MGRRRVQVGDVVQISLPTGRFAYGRILRDAGLAVYRETTDEAGAPPTGSRDFQFVVGVYSDVPGSKACPVVDHDSVSAFDDDWPPPGCVEDVITGAMQIYYKGAMRPSTPEKCAGLERAAVWELHHIVDRIMGMRDDEDDMYQPPLPPDPCSVEQAHPADGPDGVG